MSGQVPKLGLIKILEIKSAEINAALNLRRGN